MVDNKKVCMIILGLVILGLVIYYCMKKDQKEEKKESYMSAGAIDHLDSLDPRYELIESPEDAVPAEHFADLVDAGDQAKLVKQPLSGVQDSSSPFERLERLQTTEQMPLTAAHLPAFNVDVANPSTYAFATQAPRVVLKNRLAMQADFIRGDIAIRYHPDVAMVGKSQYGRDSLRLDGTFSDTFRHLYNKMTGRSFKSMPIQVATEGTIADYIP